MAVASAGLLVAVAALVVMALAGREHLMVRRSYLAARRRSVRLRTAAAEQRLAASWKAPIADATQIVGLAVGEAVVRSGRRIWRAARRHTAALAAPPPTRQLTFAQRLDTAVLEIVAGEEGAERGD